MRSTVRNCCNKSRLSKYLSIGGTNGWERGLANYNRCIRRSKSLRKKRHRSGRKNKPKNERRTQRSQNLLAWVWVSSTRSTR